MSEERLWAPWRLDYVAGGGDDAELRRLRPEGWVDGADEGCFLCRAAARYAEVDVAGTNRKLLVVSREHEVLVVLNRFPYNNGHVLVAPLRHVGEFEQLTIDEHLACIEQMRRVMSKVRKRMNAAGFNVGLNLGSVAGAGVPGHLHWHVVPRWAGDHNFMPVVGATRVIPQSLDAVWELLQGEMGKKEKD